LNWEVLVLLQMVGQDIQRPILNFENGIKKVIYHICYLENAFHKVICRIPNFANTVPNIIYRLLNFAEACRKVICPPDFANAINKIIWFRFPLPVSRRGLEGIID
jgi:hypothetical protein